MRLSFPVVGVFVLVLVAPGPALSAVKRADLAESAPRAVGATVAPGLKLTVRDTARNVGSAKARRSTMRLYLSTDRAKSRADRALGSRAVKALAPGAASTSSKQYVVPAATPAGRYFVIACADSGRAIVERSEKNNCRASSARVTVAVPPTTPQPVPQPAPGDSGGAAPAPDPVQPPSDGGGTPAPAPTAPAAPTGLAATPGSTGDVSLTWDAVTGATGYRVFRAGASGGPYTQIATPSGTSYGDTGRSDSQRYYYVVQAVNAVGSSPNSTEANALGCVDDTTSNAAGSPTNLGSVSAGSLRTFSASVCRGDQDWVQVTIINSTQATIKLEAGTAGSPEPGAAGHLRLDFWDGGAASTTGPPVGSADATTGTPQTASVGWGGGTKTFLMRVTGFTSTAANSYRITVTAIA